MSADSDIEWTDATWNPVAGCSLVSKGCTGCYAMELAHRWNGVAGSKYEGLTHVLLDSEGNPIKNGVRWNGKIREDWKAVQEPFKWRKPRKIFVNSMSDLFHKKVSTEMQSRVWEVMEATPRHTYQILTKRPKIMKAWVKKNRPVPLPNVYLGTSVESADVKKVRERIGHLRDIPAQVRFVSFEPLIGSVAEGFDWEGIDWAIVGGESGNTARPMNPKWVDEIFAKCQHHKIPFFFKQWGAFGADGVKRSKKLNGREYRGKIWSETPQSRPADFCLT